jgi:hypothetical protein
LTDGTIAQGVTAFGLPLGSGSGGCVGRPNGVMAMGEEGQESIVPFSDAFKF